MLPTIKVTHLKYCLPHNRRHKEIVTSSQTHDVENWSLRTKHSSLGALSLNMILSCLRDVHRHVKGRAETLTV